MTTQVAHHPTAASLHRGLVTPEIFRQALKDSLVKLLPQHQWRNPVMFVVWIGSILTTVLWVQALAGTGEAPAGFILAVTLWLWFTVLFANFAEAIAEGRSKAQADALRSAKRDVMAKKLPSADRTRAHALVKSTALRKGDIFLVEAGDFIPADGEVIEGVASVNESAITGESAPVIREAGGDFSSVTGGTQVLSDWLVVRVSVDPGEAFLDRMIAMVESARRQKTPNEIALSILLVKLTIVFLLTTVTLLPFSIYAVEVTKAGNPVTITVLVALLVCLIPDHDRRVAVGDRSGGDRTYASSERHRDVRPRRRSRRRCRRPAARQDRNDHAGQPPGGGARRRAWRRRARSRRCRATLFAA